MVQHVADWVAPFPSPLKFPLLTCTRVRAKTFPGNPSNSERKNYNDQAYLIKGLPETPQTSKHCGIERFQGALIRGLLKSLRHHSTMASRGLRGWALIFEAPLSDSWGNFFPVKHTSHATDCSNRWPEPIKCRGDWMGVSDWLSPTLAANSCRVLL